MLSEIRADFDRIRNLITVSRNVSDEESGEAASMINEYLCVAIAGRLEQNLKLIFVKYSERNSKKNHGRGGVETLPIIPEPIEGQDL